MNRKCRKTIAFIAALIVVAVSFGALLTTFKRNDEKVRAAGARAAGQDQTSGVVYFTNLGDRHPNSANGGP